MNNSFLTPREIEIFNYLVNNMTTKEIAKKLGISDKTVRNHVSNVILKLDVKKIDVPQLLNLFV
ncbi:MAG: helix-turn-helix transcriptional regulator [Clostridium sp.]|nr:MAG: helix-turn-helix transcriptional regulator [Clostridium sp.]